MMLDAVHRPMAERLRCSCCPMAAAAQRAPPARLLSARARWRRVANVAATMAHHRTWGPRGIVMGARSAAPHPAQLLGPRDPRARSSRRAAASLRRRSAPRGSRLHAAPRALRGAAPLNWAAQPRCRRCCKRAAAARSFTLRCSNCRAARKQQRRRLHALQNPPHRAMQCRCSGHPTHRQESTSGNLATAALQARPSRRHQRQLRPRRRLSRPVHPRRSAAFCHQDRRPLAHSTMQLC